LAALLSACLPMAGSIWVVVLLLVPCGACISLILSATSALSTLLGRKIGMSNTMGFLGTANSAGTIAGYLSLGFITDLFNISVPFYFTAVVVLLGLAGFILLWRKNALAEILL
jgi:hypothetical protein